MKTIVWITLICTMLGCGNSSSYNRGYVISKTHGDELPAAPETEEAMPLPD